MKDKFIKKLLGDLDGLAITAGEVKIDVENMTVDETSRIIPLDRLIGHIETLDKLIEEDIKENIPKTKFLYVEDGSVDVDDLQISLFNTNPEIKVIVYRQGSHPPILSKEKETL